VTCRELADFILDYVSGELPAPARAEFDYHLRKCPNCCRYLASYQQTVTMGQRAFGEDDGQVPPEVPQQLIAAILAARRRLKPDSPLR
jgi:anti-sigma factor RsiW